MFYWITVAGKNILMRPNSFLTFGRSYKTYRFYSLLCITGHSPGNCFFSQQVLHQPQPSPCVSQELPAGTQMLASLSQALPALLAQLIFLVACVSTLPCFLLQLLARRKEEDFSYPFLLSGRDVWWNLLAVVLAVLEFRWTLWLPCFIPFFLR